ncbi:hypothetical protein [Micromonospora sp. WMMD980]|uniref:hypothetical protein n=1 Tax=Micromonospora sp. WMMD980 TaxID=3016088 RepID=UPI002416EF31|nr:hypothetical protein [Micromonospora sp. WMMD980]MDG4798998.1 hypothetical protein [Micromonospora sp. WMMD980]MDG4799064.1 hypothetical protein [Micromonospora sp. WMMD980]
MNEPTLMELIREYGRTMDVAGRYAALGSAAAGPSERQAGRLYDEIERRIDEIKAAHLPA